MGNVLGSVFTKPRQTQRQCHGLFSELPQVLLLQHLAEMPKDKITPILCQQSVVLLGNDTGLLLVTLLGIIVHFNMTGWTVM